MNYQNSLEIIKISKSKQFLEFQETFDEVEQKFRSFTGHLEFYKTFDVSQDFWSSTNLSQFHKTFEVPQDFWSFTNLSKFYKTFEVLQDFQSSTRLSKFHKTFKDLHIFRNSKGKSLIAIKKIYQTSNFRTIRIFKNPLNK